MCGSCSVGSVAGSVMFTGNILFTELIEISLYLKFLKHAIFSSFWLYVFWSRNQALIYSGRKIIFSFPKVSRQTNIVDWTYPTYTFSTVIYLSLTMYNLIKRYTGAVTLKLDIDLKSFGLSRKSMLPNPPENAILIDKWQISCKILKLIEVNNALKGTF